MNTPDYRILRINSDARVSGTNTNFKVQFNDHKMQSVLYYTVKSISFPNLFNNIDSRNNTFTWFSTANAGNFSVTIPVGYYSSTQLMSTLGTLMTTAMAGLPGPPVVTIALGSFTQAFDFTVTNDTITLLSDISVNPAAGVTGITSDVGPSATPSAPSVPNLYGEQLVYLHSRQLNNSRALLSSGVSVSSFAEVPITAEYGGLQQYVMEENHAAVFFTNGVNQSTISIKLRSIDGTILTLPANQRVIIILKAWY